MQAYAQMQEKMGLFSLFERRKREFQETPKSVVPQGKMFNPEIVPFAGFSSHLERYFLYFSN